MRELEDFKWFPGWLRTHQTEFLTTIAQKLKLYQPIKPMLHNILSSSPNHEWTDVCSGYGGPVMNLIQASNSVLLCDLYPPTTQQHLPSNISYHQKPVDILQQSPPGKGLVTMFNSFHHFSGKEQTDILKAMNAQNRNFLAIEVLLPTPICMLKVIFTTTIGHWLMVPFMRPFSLKRIFFTYFLPIHTLTVLYDGIVSVIKSKKLSFYKSLAAGISCDRYRVEVNKVKGTFGPLITIKGEPVVLS